MKIIIAADTHTMHDQVVVPDGDVFVHAGDFTWKGRVHEIGAFNEWLGTLPHPHKVIIAGNHDILFEEQSSLAQSMLTNCTHYLQDSKCVIDGISFWGSPWSPWFYDWAFNLHRCSEDMKRVWAMIPTGIDVLITHGPPHGVLDMCPDLHMPRRDISVGCEVLRDELKRVKPKVHIFGHVHENAGRETHDDTLYVNASVVNGNCLVSNPVQVIEVE